MRRQPVIVLLVGGVVVENDVNLLRRRNVFEHVVHEGLKVSACLGCGGFVADMPGCHVQGGKKIERAVAPVGAFETAHDLAARGSNIAGAPGKRLNARLFVNAQDQGLVRRSQTETIRRVRMMAVNMEARMPMASVTAKPLTGPVPN